MPDSLGTASRGANQKSLGISWLLLLVSLAISVVAVSRQSFWIDEANSGFKAIQGTFSAFHALMLQERGSDLQMPVYMGMLWAWEKIFGPSEFWLRAMNIPFFLAAQASVLFALKRPALQRYSFAVIACLSPMLWIYLDEARPYILQFSGATLVMVALLNLGDKDARHPLLNGLLFCAGSLVLVGSSLTGVIYVIFYAAFFCILWFRTESIKSTFSQPALLLIGGVSVGLMAILGLYYLWTLKVGARASSVGQTNATTVIFCIYELLGFSGMGPGRTSLRESGVAALKPYLAQLAVFFLGLAAFVCASLATVRKTRSLTLGTLIIISSAALGLLAILACGIVMDFRVLGRHLMPFLPFLIFLFAILLASLLESPSKTSRIIAAAYLLLLLLSSLGIRFSTRFAKDDYRDAAKLALHAMESGRRVWWAADIAGARFYGLFPAELGQDGQAFVANRRDVAFLAELPPADLVILSKEDIYDPEGHLRSMLQVRGFTVTLRFPAMTVYEHTSRN